VLAVLLLRALVALVEGPNDKYLRPDLDVPAWVRSFESPGREVFDKRKEIVAGAGLRPGAAVADVGAGTGLFTMLFAEAVGPQGKVYAVDISPKFLAHIASRVKRAGVKNVATVRGSDRSIELPAASVDLVFLCDTYHHFEHPKESLASIKRALRPGGALVVVDYRREPGKSKAWVLDHVRAGEAAVAAEIEAAGFVRDTGKLPALDENYFLRFTVPTRARP
jgi:ubiquinone/menaquinone biosynthesis C-methylase UbiE